MTLSPLDLRDTVYRLAPSEYVTAGRLVDGHDLGRRAAWEREQDTPVGARGGAR